MYTMVPYWSVSLGPGGGGEGKGINPLLRLHSKLGHSYLGALGMTIVTNLLLSGEGTALTGSLRSDGLARTVLWTPEFLTRGDHGVS